LDKTNKQTISVDVDGRVAGKGNYVKLGFDKQFVNHNNERRLPKQASKQVKRFAQNKDQHRASWGSFCSDNSSTQNHDFSSGRALESSTLEARVAKDEYNKRRRHRNALQQLRGKPRYGNWLVGDGIAPLKTWRRWRRSKWHKIKYDGNFPGLALETIHSALIIVTFKIAQKWEESLPLPLAP